MKCLISYQFTGISKESLDRLINSASNALETINHDYYCIFLERHKFIGEDYSEHLMMNKAFQQIEASDYVLVLYDQPAKSAGMLMEIGYALAKNKPILMAINARAEPGYVKDMATQKFVYDNYQDLAQKLPAESSRLANQIRPELASQTHH